MGGRERRKKARGGSQKFLQRHGVAENRCQAGELQVVQYGWGISVRLEKQTKTNDVGSILRLSRGLGFLLRATGSP